MTAPRVSCCKPMILQRPSGLSWSHSKFCKVAKYEHISRVLGDEAWFAVNKLRNIPRRDLDPWPEWTRAHVPVAGVPGDERCPVHDAPRYDCPGCEAQVDQMRGK